MRYTCALCGGSFDEEPTADLIVSMAIDLQSGLLTPGEPTEVICDDCHELIKLREAGVL